MASKRPLAGSDLYAYKVARDLVERHHFGKTRAINSVQGDEAYVRKAYGANLPPAYVAKRIALGRSAGQKKPRKRPDGRVHGRIQGVHAGSGRLGPAGIEALRTTDVEQVSRRTPGMASGSSACGIDPNWQPPLFGEDMSISAIETLDGSVIAPHEAVDAFKHAATSFPLIHQYFLTAKSKVKDVPRLSRMRMPGALYVEKTGNTKVIGGPNYRAKRKMDGKVAAATYASISSSCPDECALRDNGCYAQQGKTSMTIRRLDAEAHKYHLTSVDTAAAEAYSIYTSYSAGPVKGRTYLRVHVGGDSQTVPGTMLIADAVRDWIHRGGIQAWCYTHAWFKVPRKAWGAVSTLASLDDPPREISKAKGMGYAPAVVVQSFGMITAMHKVPGGWRVDDFETFQREMRERRAVRKFEGDNTGTVYHPCPAQTGEFDLRAEEFAAGLKDPSKGKRAGVGCLDCQLCFNEDLLRKNNRGIMFEAHGPKTRRALEMLGQVRAPRDIDMEV
jgi:hypothetical protein